MKKLQRGNLADITQKLPPWDVRAAEGESELNDESLEQSLKRRVRYFKAASPSKNR
jgi:hypothetical protein